MHASNVTHQWKRPGLCPESDHVLARQPLATSQRNCGLWVHRSTELDSSWTPSSVLPGPTIRITQCSCIRTKRRHVVWFPLANLYRASNRGDFVINLTMHSSEAYLNVLYQADCLLGGCLRAFSSFNIQLSLWICFWGHCSDRYWLIKSY